MVKLWKGKFYGKKLSATTVIGDNLTFKMSETIYNAIPNAFITVQMYDKANLPLIGAETDLLLNPVSILLFGNNQANTDVEVKNVNIQYNPIDICFSTIPSDIPAFKCVYWDEATYKWSTAGVSISNSNSDFKI